MSQSDFADVFKLSKMLETHAVEVAAHHSKDIGIEPAILRVFEHLAIVLQDGMEGGRPDDMALALKPKV
jgi:hypothetical protein